MEQREVDNMLLSMIQKHFPSLPLSDEHTDWGKWLGFARAVYEAGRASPASVPEGWKLVPEVPTEAMQDAMRSVLNMPANSYWAMLDAAPTPPVSEDRKDAERYRVLKSGDFSVEQFVSSSYGWKFVPMEELDAAIDAAMTGGHAMSFALEDAGYWNSPEQCDATNEIVTLRAQIEKLTKELNNVKQVEFPRRVQKVTDALKRKHEKELAALAEQNEKQKDALLYVMRATCLSADDNPDSPIGMLYKRASNAYELPDLASPVLNSIPKEPTLPVFDADSPRFRQEFDEAVQEHNLPGKRKGEGYRSPITQWCFEIAYSVVNRLRLYEK